MKKSINPTDRLNKVFEEIQKNKPKVKLVGKDGNVFNLMAICSRALKRVGQPENAEKLMEGCMSAGSYDEALVIMMKYCEVE